VLTGLDTKGLEFDGIVVVRPRRSRTSRPPAGPRSTSCSPAPPSCSVGPLLLLGVLAFLVPVGISLVGQMFQSGGSVIAGRAGTDTGLGLAAVGAGGVVGFAVSVAAQIVSLFFTAALIRAAFDVTEGRRVDLGLAFSRWDKAQVLVLAILCAIGTMIGLVLCILPGIVFLFFTWFATYFVVGSGQNAIEAIASSFRFAIDHIGNLLLLFLLSAVIVIAGACACGIGLLVAMPIVTIAAAYTFRVLQGQPVAAV
jgi:hypothetical protein